MNRVQQMTWALGAMWVAYVLLDLIPGTAGSATTDGFFVGSAGSVAWVALASFVSGVVGGSVGGRRFPLIALASYLVVATMGFALLQAVAAPVDPVGLGELVARNVWSFAAALVSVYLGAHVGAQASWVTVRR